MNNSILAIATAALFATTLAACSHKADKPAEAPMQVSVATPVIDSVTLVKSYPAFLTAVDRVDVVGRVNGTLRSKNYVSGDRVVKGQVLFTIEDSQYRDAVERAAAALASAQSAYDYASKQYHAMELALKSDAVSRMEVEQAKSAMEEALASIKTAKAQLSTARLNLSYCTVTAPISGLITDAVYSTGNYIGGEAAPVVLATIYNNSTMKLEFTIDDAQYITMLRDGKSPEVTRDLSHVALAFGDSVSNSYTADLDYIAPAINKSTGSIQFKGSVANPRGELRDGMYTRVMLPYRFEPRAILVHDDAISTDQRGKFLYTVNDSNKVVYTPVEVGQTVRDSLRVITGGITPSTRYVTRALLKVRDGMTVTPVTSR